jgi:hypothetical protein
MGRFDFWYYFIGFTIIFIVLSWGFMILSTQAHEDVHVAIFDNYNISSTVKINKLTGQGFTYPNVTQYYLYCNDDCKFANSLNEITSYNTDKIAFAILIGLYLISILVILIKIGGKECADSSDSTGETQNQKKY